MIKDSYYKLTSNNDTAVRVYKPAIMQINSFTLVTIET